VPGQGTLQLTLLVLWSRGLKGYGQHAEMVVLFAGAKDLAERLKKGEVDTAHIVGISVPEEIPA
jgi:hypothetical protein